MIKAVGNRVLKSYCNSKLSFFIICYASGLAIFAIGFMTIKSVNLQMVSVDDLFIECSEVINNDTCSYHKDAFKSFYYKRYNKVVWIIIDALRADFVPSVKSNLSNMPFTENLMISGSVLSFITRVFAPSVTMPRIKTLVTGSIFSFTEILTNFNAVELSMDNIIYQAKMKNLQTIFYGDNTWLKLFPNIFVRSEGTHSFYVSDFKEVDSNVTRNLAKEFHKEDWTIMVLHYLGIDHIGHAYGAYSSHISPKLKEMDEVIKFVYNNIKIFSGKPSLIIVCGDHGMTSSGSHGGITDSEMHTPLIFIRTDGPKYSLTNQDKIVSQVDFAATLSVLLGIPIPVNSFGNVVTDVLKFSGLSPQEILLSLFYNFLQLMHVYKATFPFKYAERFNLAHRLIMNHTDWVKYNGSQACQFLIDTYKTELINIKEELLRNIAGYNEFLMILGLMIIWLSLLWCTISLISEECISGRINILHVCFKTILVSKFVLFYPLIVFLYLFITGFLQSIFVGLLILGSLFACHTLYFILQLLFKGVFISFTEKTIALLFILHALSLFSSSYIEEEHQIWYYFLCTVLHIYFIKCILHTFNYYQMNFHDINLKSKINKQYVVLSLLIMHRIFRSWNQTGDKWQHLHDISDWLSHSQNAHFLNILVFIAELVIIVYLKKRQNLLTKCITFSGFLLVYVYKCHMKVLLEEKDTYSNVFIPRLLYMHVILILITGAVKLFKYGESNMAKAKELTFCFISAWVLLIQIIGRTYNIPLIAGILVMENYLKRMTWKNSLGHIDSILCYLIMTWASFFYQGNSNSLSAIDVYSGYTGLASYQPILVGFLLICNTYSNVILWLSLLLYRMLHHLVNVDNYASKKILLCFRAILIYRLFVLALYCIVIYVMRHHLFILSVFTPKLYYEVAYFILFVLINIFIYLLIRT